MPRNRGRICERYCVVSIFIDERVFRLAPERLPREVVPPLFTSLLCVKTASAHQTLVISTADVEFARDLESPLNAPVAEIRRVLCAPDGSVTYIGEATYRGDYIRLEMDLKP